MICATTPAGTSSHSVRLANQRRSRCKVRPAIPAALRAPVCGFCGLAIGPALRLACGLPASTFKGLPLPIFAAFERAVENTQALALGSPCNRLATYGVSAMPRSPSTLSRMAMPFQCRFTAAHFSFG